VAGAIQIVLRDLLRARAARKRLEQGPAPEPATAEPQL